MAQRRRFVLFAGLLALAFIVSALWFRGIWPSSTSVDLQVRPAPPKTPRSEDSERDSADLSKCAVINGKSSELKIVTLPWAVLNRGEQTGAYTLAEDGSLHYEARHISQPLSVSTVSGNHGTEQKYARSVVISPLSPSGRFALLKGCEEADSAGLCWATFVIDLSSKRVYPTFGGRYGPNRWVAWITGAEEYAILRYQSEGSQVYYRVHLATGESAECSPWRTLPPGSSHGSR